MWKTIVEPDRLQMTIWRMHITCWIPKTKYTLSEYIKHTAFPLHQLYERASALRYGYLACLLTSVWRLPAIQTATYCIPASNVVSSEAFSLLWPSLTEELSVGRNSIIALRLKQSTWLFTVGWSQNQCLVEYFGDLRSEVETLNLTVLKIFSPLPRRRNFKEKLCGE